MFKVSSKAVVSKCQVNVCEKRWRVGDSCYQADWDGKIR